MKRQLFVKVGAIGDVVMAMTAVHRRLDKEKLDFVWLAGKSVESLIRRLLPQVELIGANDEALLNSSPVNSFRELSRINWKLCGSQFDRIAIGYRDRRYSLLSLSVFSKERVSFVSRPGVYHADIYYELLGGQRGDLLNTPLNPSSLLKNRSVGVGLVLAPGGAKNLLRDDWLRRYPISHYVELAKQALGSGKSVTLLGSKSDDWIKPYFSGLPIKFELGTLPLEEIPFWLQQFERIITHDSGPMHLGFLSGVPVTALFGPTRSDEKVPRNYADNGSVVIQGGKGLSCAPCYDGKNYAACQHQKCLAEVVPRLDKFIST